MNLEPKGGVWAIDSNLGVIRVWLVFKALRLDEVTKKRVGQEDPTITFRDPSESNQLRMLNEVGGKPGECGVKLGKNSVSKRVWSDVLNVSEMPVN